MSGPIHSTAVLKHLTSVLGLTEELLGFPPEAVYAVTVNLTAGHPVAVIVNQQKLMLPILASAEEIYGPICELLGLEPNTVRSASITADDRELAMVDVQMYLQSDQIGVLDHLRGRELTKAGDRP